VQARFVVTATTADAAAAVRGIGFNTGAWTQSTGAIAAGVAAGSTYLFAMVPTALCLFFRYNTASADVQRPLYLTLAASRIERNNNFKFFTHESTFDARRGEWASCRAALKYCARDPGDGVGVVRTLLGLSKSTGNYELQARYPDASTMWQQNTDPAFTIRANFDARLVTTFVGINDSPSGVLKIDLEGVDAYTRPFTIYAVRESRTTTTSDSLPALIYTTVDGVPALVVQSKNNGTAVLKCTLPSACRVIYRYNGGDAGDLTVRLDATDQGDVAHTQSYMGEPTRTPDFVDETWNGLVIFHVSVVRAELVTSPPDTKFTPAESSALLTWARRNTQ
jgi:hypothetical protein